MSGIRVREKAAFASGEILGGGAVALLGVLYLKFLTDIVLIDAGISGTIILLSKFWDAISDPLMGVISDNTRTRWGRRRPYIFASAFGVIIALMLLFAPIGNAFSEVGKVLFMLFAYVFYSTISTVFNVPYLSLSSEITTNINERNKMNLFRLIVAGVAGAICYVLPTQLFAMYNSGVITLMQFYLILSIGFGLFFAIPALLVAIFTNERTPIPNVKSQFNIESFIAPFKLKAFVYLLILYVFSFICTEMIAAVIINYVTFIVDGAMPAILVQLAMLGAAGIMMPLMFIFLNKGVSKPKVFRIGIPIYMLGGVLLVIFNNSWNPYLLIGFAVITGIGLGLAQIIPWLTFPDVVDVSELKTGDRNPGAYNGVMTFSKKFSSGIGVFIVGWALKFSGYNGELAVQPPSAIMGIRIVIIASVVIFLSIAYFGASKLKISNNRSEKIKYFIELQREGTIDELNEIDQAQLDIIKRELF